MSSLGTLVAALQSRGPLDRSYPEMETLLRSVDGWPANRPLAHRPGGYTRTLLYGDDIFEMLLLNWDLNARSAVHDHGGQHCWMAVLTGNLQVDDYARIDDGSVPGEAQVEARGSRLLSPRDLDLRSGPLDLHRVSAVGATKAISLHVYAAPLHTYLVYDELAGRCRSATGTYDDTLSSIAFA
jgi:cysteine dioxygenase